MPAAPPPPTAWDVHQHHGISNADRLSSPVRPDLREGWLDAEYAQRCDQMERLGVAKTVLMPTNGYPRENGASDTARANDLVLACVKRDPVRFLAAVGVVEPSHGPASLDELRRLRDLGFLGVQYHPRYQGVAADDPWIRRQLEVVRELGLVAFIHSYADSALEAPVLIERAARAVPDQTIVVLDGLSSHARVAQWMDAATRCPNLLFDTSHTWTTHVIHQAVSELGPERVLFGSNIYSNSPPASAVTPAFLADHCGLSDPELQLVLHGNLERLLTLHGSS